MAVRTFWRSPGDLPGIAAVSLIAISGVFLWSPWLTAGAAEEQTSKTAFWFLPVGLTLLLLTLGTAALMFISLSSDHNLRAPILVTSALALAPGLFVISLVEFAQSLVPTWLTPVLTNSELLTLRAEYGVWAHAGLVIGGLALWIASDSMTAGGDLINSRRAAGRIALLLAVIALPVIRALPLFSVTVSRDGVGEETQRLAVVEIVPGEVPVLGVVSTVAILGFVALSLLAFIRPRNLALIGASAALGLHLSVVWLQVTTAQIVDGILPNNWSELIGNWLAVEITTLHTSTLTLLVSTAGFAAILLLASGHSNAIQRSSQARTGPAAATEPHSSTAAHSLGDDLP